MRNESEFMCKLVFEKKRRLDIIVMGKLCGSLFVTADKSGKKNSCVKNIEGTAANIAAALSVNGIKTGYIGRIAKDDLGKATFNYLSSLQVDTSNVVLDADGSITGITFLEEPCEEDGISEYVDKIADFKLSPENIDERFIKQARALFLSGTLLAQGSSKDAAFLALEYARRNGLVVYFDMDYRPYLWRSREEAAVYCSLAAEKSDVVFGTKDEFDMLEALINPNNEKEFSVINKCFRHHAKVVVVKHESHEPWIYTRSNMRVPIKRYDTAVINSFGANDAFIESFIYDTMRTAEIPVSAG